MKSNNAEALIAQLHAKYVHTSSVAQLLPPLSTRIEEEKISGICDALSISFLTTQAKRQKFPNDNKYYSKQILDQLVRYQCIHSSDQQAAAKHVLKQIGLSWFSGASDKNTVPSCNVSSNGFEKMVSLNQKYMEGVVKNLKNEKNEHGGPAFDVGTLFIHSMLYFKKPGVTGDHNCSAVFLPNGSVHYFDPNIGVFVFQSHKDCGDFIQLLAPKLKYGDTLEALFFFDRIPLFKIPGYSTAHPLLDFKYPMKSN